MKYILFVLTSMVFMSCSNAQQDKPLEQLDKKSAREVILVTEVKGDSVLHITKQHIWFNGEKIAAQNDTIITAKHVNTWSVGDTTQTLSEVPIYVTVQ
jgi:O-methyltransferase involved in polyketide biosynthesis